MKLQNKVMIIFALLAIFLTSCGEKQKPAKKSLSSADSLKSQLKLFKSLPAEMLSKNNALSQEKTNLGRMLFFDKRLSKNQDISCNSCHGLKKFGVDGLQFSNGHKKQKGGRNAPTVYNAALHIAQFWDGRAANVEEQAGGPILNPVEMAMPSKASVLNVLESIPDYVEYFKKAFPNNKKAITYENMTQAIGAFERKLVTPSRWDEFLDGDQSALSKKEKIGFKDFMAVGCAACHNGQGVGGNLYQKLGLIKPWPNRKDKGRFEITKKEEDMYFFKVPSLRNIEKTAPYMHDGSIKTLEKSVAMMAEHQLGKTLSEEKIASIISFLKSLTGKIPTAYIKEPVLPKNGPNTPNADPN